MNKRTLLLRVILLLFLWGCSRPRQTETPTPTFQASPTLPGPGVNTTQAPSSEAAARAFLDAWEAEDYSAMYAMLTSLSREAISEENFTAYYRNLAAEAALNGIETKILSSLTQTRTAQVSYRVTLRSVLVGEVQRDTMMNLSLEDGVWRVQWDASLILPELAGGNLLRMEYLIPSRGNIYDRNGHALVAQADAVAIGLSSQTR
jgi:hypothetical protein